MNYIENPNFPKGKSTVVAVSSEAKDVIDALQSAKICVVPVDPCSSLPEGIASHADLQLLHLGSNSMLTASCSNKCEEMLKSIGFDLKAASSPLGEKYPADCILNAAILGKNIIINPAAADKLLMEYIYSNNMNIIAVNQGYSNCSILSVCSDAIITSDRGIAKAAEENGIETLLINEGGIYLKGYNTGLIGGCGGMIENKILGTSGDMKQLKDFDNIKDFLRNRNIYIENLGAKELCDIGGILPLCEE